MPLQGSEPWSAQTVNAKTDDAWPVFFFDPKLNALVREAWENNLDLKIAAANLEKVKASQMSANAGLLPRAGLNFQGENTKEGRIASTNEYQANLQVNWEIDLWGRLAARKTAAQQELTAFELDFQAGQIEAGIKAATADQKAAITQYAQTGWLSSQRALLEQRINLFLALGGSWDNSN